MVIRPFWRLVANNPKIFFCESHFFLDFCPGNLYAYTVMGIQNKADKRKFSQLRQSLVQLADEIRQLVGPFLSDRPVIKGSVYELKRKCGKPGCKCAHGELHRRMVVSASEKGKTKLRVVPRGSLVEIERKVRRYQKLRRVRTRLVDVHKKILRIMDEMEAMRREEVPSPDKKRSSLKG